jgi:hypothetical protein
MQHDYEIEYRGRIIRCRTAEAANRILGILEQQDTMKDDLGWNDRDFTAFTNRIQLQQRKLLAKLLEYGTTTLVQDVKLREHLDITNNQALAGILSGITKVALALNIEPKCVYSQRTRFRKGKPERFYQIGSGFLRAASTCGWPTADDLKRDPEPKAVGARRKG